LSDLRYRIVDVFSDRPLAGNALCVVLDPCPESLMQAIAREANLSETTFPTVTGPGAYRVRIFTPTVELPFAGHPTVGTAWVLGPGAWTQASAGATVAVEADARGARVTQPEPAITAIDPATAVAAAGLPGAEGAWVAEAGGVRHVVVATDAPIDAIRPDLALVASVTDAARGTTFAVVRRRTDTELHVRVFVPSAGVAEDPGTGSAAGPIGVIARSLWSTGTALTIRQGAEVGRPCTIEVDVSGPAPVVGGRVAPCAEGVLTL
jgi:trans-2,3-dihydro-3-hydroxyanthranilate isomerase